MAVDYTKNKQVNIQRLIDYGFIKEDESYVYSTLILDDEFCLRIIVDNNVLKTELKECATNEIYTLHLVEGAKGTFVGTVKNEYEKIIKNIIDSCFEKNVFEWEYSRLILDYALTKYGSEAEYLWEKFPRNAVCRRPDNKKWFFALLSVQKNRLGFDSDEIVEIVDLRVPPEDMAILLKNPNIYPGYHMNKKHWISIILDGSMAIEEIYRYIDSSYELALK